MNVRVVNLSNLSHEDASMLHTLLESFESETNKFLKIKLFEPDHCYESDKHIPFRVTETMVRRTKIKNDLKIFVYTVYSNAKLMGQGGFGTVYSVSGILKHADGKMIYKSKQEKPQVIKKYIERHDSAKLENSLAQKLPDTKMKKITFIYREGEKCLSFNVMAEIKGEDFSDTILRHPYTILQKIVLSISAWNDLKRIDTAGIIQRDIKPDNMRVNHANMSLRILDFGIGREKDTVDEKSVGSYPWKSPDMIANRKTAGAGCDVYSMGLVLGMLFGDKQVRLDKRTLIKDVREKRRKQYASNNKYPLWFDDKNIKQWKQEYPWAEMKKLEEILLSVTTARPENRSTIDSALSGFIELLRQVPMQYAFTQQDAPAIAMLLKVGVKPDYAAFTKAVDDSLWECVLSFVKANPENIASSIDCEKAYTYALSASNRTNTYDDAKTIDPIREVNKLISSLLITERNEVENECETNRHFKAFG